MPIKHLKNTQSSGIEITRFKKFMKPLKALGLTLEVVNSNQTVNSSSVLLIGKPFIFSIEKNISFGNLLCGVALNSYDRCKVI